MSPVELQQELVTLRQAVSDIATKYSNDDAILTRYILTAHHDLAKAEKRLRATLAFRKQYGADTILEDFTPHPVLQENFIVEHTGFNKEGYPVIRLCYGMIDSKGLIRCFSRADIFRTKIYIMEKLEAIFRAAGNRSGLFIVDFTGVSGYHMSRDSLEIICELVNIERQYYPGFAHQMLLVNYGKIVELGYTLIKPFVGRDTKEKLVFLGSEWRQGLHERLAPELIPAEYGGTFVTVRKPVKDYRIPKSYYRENNDSLTKMYVKAGKRFCIQVPVEQPGFNLAWEFVTEDHDIAFGVSFVANQKPGTTTESEDGGVIIPKEATTIVPTERCNAHMDNVEGLISCNEPGVYYLEWDNSFSWTKGKNVAYKFDLISTIEIPSGDKL